MFVGGDPTALNEKGHRPIMYARDDDVKNYLEQEEAKVFIVIVFVNVFKCIFIHIFVYCKFY